MCTGALRGVPEPLETENIIYEGLAYYHVPMSGEDAASYTFVCPECRERLAVNASMRDALLEKGCVICGSDVTPASFSGESSCASP